MTINIIANGTEYTNIREVIAMATEMYNNHLDYMDELREKINSTESDEEIDRLEDEMTECSLKNAISIEIVVDGYNIGCVGDWRFWDLEYFEDDLKKHIMDTIVDECF